MCYRLGNVRCLPPGTLVGLVGWCRHHPRLVSAGEIQQRWTSHSTASPTSCPGLGLGAAAAHAELEVGRLRPSDTGALPACRCQGQGEHLPLVNTSLSNHFPLSVVSIGLLFILVSYDDNITWTPLQDSIVPTLRIGYVSTARLKHTGLKSMDSDPLCLQERSPTALYLEVKLYLLHEKTFSPSASLSPSCGWIWSYTCWYGGQGWMDPRQWRKQIFFIETNDIWRMVLPCPVYPLLQRARTWKTGVGDFCCGKKRCSSPNTNFSLFDSLSPLFLLRDNQEESSPPRLCRLLHWTCNKCIHSATCVCCFKIILLPPLKRRSPLKIKLELAACRNDYSHVRKFF